MATFCVLPLAANHDRTGFDSGSEPLDRYFQHQASQDIRRRIANCFVALTRDQGIAGYYTLAAASVVLADLPETLRQKLPRYPTVPAVRLGRLAVARGFQRQGLGAALLADALARTLRSDIAAYALLVDAKDQTAADFYQHHGFMRFPERDLMLFLPLQTATALLL